MENVHLWKPIVTPRHEPKEKRKKCLEYPHTILERNLDNFEVRRPGGGEEGGGEVHSESYTRGARFLTRWDQQAVAQEEKEEEEVIDVIGGVYSESYTRGAE